MALEALVNFLTVNPEITAAVVTLLGSLGVALSKRFGGEQFVLVKRLVALLTKPKPKS